MLIKSRILNLAKSSFWSLNGEAAHIVIQILDKDAPIFYSNQTKIHFFGHNHQKVTTRLSSHQAIT